LVGLYKTSYLNEPGTADQFSVAELNVMFVALSEEGVAQLVLTLPKVKVPELPISLRTHVTAPFVLVPSPDPPWLSHVVPLKWARFTSETLVMYDDPQPLEELQPAVTSRLLVKLSLWL